MFQRRSSELGKAEGDGEVAAFLVGFPGVTAGMNRVPIPFGILVNKWEGGKQGMMYHELVMIWIGMVYVFE